MKSAFFTGLLAAIILLVSIPAYSEYTLSPVLSIREAYNDNIFLDSTNEEDDFITTVSPSIDLFYRPGKTLDLNLFYGLNFKFYNDHNNLNDEDIDDSQNILLKAYIKPTNYFFIDILNSYERIPFDVRKKSALENVHENMTDRNELIVSPYVKLPVTSTVTVTGGYDYESIWYSEDDAVDYENHTAFITLEKKITPRIGGALQYKYIIHSPDADDEAATPGELEYNRHEASLTADYRVTDNLTVNAVIGETWVEYESIEDKEVFIWGLGIDDVYKINEYTILGFHYGVDFSDSANSGLIKTHEVGAKFETGKTVKLILSPYYKNVESLAVNREDRVLGATIELSRPITKRINITLHGKWENDQLLPEDEDITLYSLGSNLNYTLNRDIQMSVGYIYNTQDASTEISTEDIEINDYENNIVWVLAKAVF